MTALYFGFADDRLTSARPRSPRFFRTISAFRPFTSGMVTWDVAALVLVALGFAKAECWVTVTVDNENGACHGAGRAQAGDRRFGCRLTGVSPSVIVFGGI